MHLQGLKNIVIIFELYKAIYAKGSCWPTGNSMWMVSTKSSSFHNFFHCSSAVFTSDRRPFYSGLIKEPRGEPKIRNASGIWRAISRYPSPTNEIHLHGDKCSCALAGIDSCDVTELISDVKFYVSRFSPLNKIRVSCFSATCNLYENHHHMDN